MLEASYAIAKIIAKTKQPRTIGESLVLSCCRETVKITINKSAVEEVQKVLLSDNSISRRIDDMSDDILSQLKDSLMKSEVFALQLDESTDIQEKGQLPANFDVLKTIAYKKTSYSAEKYRLTQLEKKSAM